MISINSYNTFVLTSNALQLVSTKTFIILLKQYYFLIQQNLVNFPLFHIMIFLLLSPKRSELNWRSQFVLDIEQRLFSTPYIHYFVQIKRSKNIPLLIFIIKINIPP